MHLVKRPGAQHSTSRVTAVAITSMLLVSVAGFFAPVAASAADSPESTKSTESSTSASSARTSPQGGYSELWVPSSMGNIKVQVQWAARGGSAALYLLDGLRAPDDRNTWSYNTTALDQYRNDNITLVLPVGGESSFYTDWYAPSNVNAQQITYRWETFLTRELPDFLVQYGISPNNNAIVGVSMGGSAALNLAAHHRDQFIFAGSLSGYINTSAPGMREAIRLAMLEGGGYNVDSMWGPPWSPAWLRNDPYVNAELLRGLPMYISASSGLPGPYDNPSTVGDYATTSSAVALEVLALAHARSFQAHLDALGISATYSFPANGTHSWPYWSAELGKARSQLLTTMNAW